MVLPQIIISTCALFISVVSIILTMLTLNMQKKHNSKSVRPIARITVGDYEDDIYVSVINNGVGPLVIKRFNAEHKFRGSASTSSSTLIDIIPKELNDKVIWTDFASNFDNRALKAGERLYLLRQKFDDNDANKDENMRIRTDLRQFLQHVTIELRYTDIYEKLDGNETRKLDWFGRHFDDLSPHKQKHLGTRH